MTPLFKKTTSMQLIVVGFFFLIFIGAFLLTLPASSSNGYCQSFLDALFTAGSAVTTTGLVVVGTGSFYSSFGQMIILALFQIGGLGYMIIIALVVLGIGGRLSISGQTLLRQSITRPTSVDMIRFAKIILLFTLLFELAGTIFLGFSWMRFFPCEKAFYLAAFHSVSAFCTAGFSLFPDSLKAYNECFSINLIISLLALCGGTGFFCLYELFVLLPEKRFMKQTIRLSAHTKIVLSSTALLILIGAGIIWIAGNGVRASIFQAVSASTTTGFNTIEIGNMHTSSLWIILFLMFVGASPGGSGGGIKTVSFVLLLAFLRSHLSGRNDVFVFKNRVPQRTMQKVFAISITAMVWIFTATGILMYTEKAAALDILFQVVSALGTVGLSTGITQELSSAGKVVIILSMFIGRAGPLAIAYSLVGRKKPSSFTYPEADIVVS
ncbi:MAG: potassium transporter TrkG [Thermodesulfobacteriota bacterium]|nr:potassium transporter TrkG [Thermodesulfobacteriota bacterium]